MLYRHRRVPRSLRFCKGRVGGSIRQPVFLSSSTRVRTLCPLARPLQKRKERGTLRPAGVSFRLHIYSERDKLRGTRVTFPLLCYTLYCVIIYTWQPISLSTTT